MALYAIGDVQGCYDELQRLLDKISFDPAHDRLWFTGDLVNRGPHSLKVLRLVARLGTRAVSVLGNHDLHLLAVASGARPPGERDTFQDVLTAPDRGELLAWLATRPLLHDDPEADLVLVHAGLLPQWDIALARACAREAEAVIAGPNNTEFFSHMYGNSPDRWSDDLGGHDRLRLIVNAFTRLRFCYPDGRMDYIHHGAPGSQPAPLLPWFAAPTRKNGGACIVFGHWSLLGAWKSDSVIGIDSGCCWGRQLTAIRLDDGGRELVCVECPSR